MTDHEGGNPSRRSRFGRFFSSPKESATALLHELFSREGVSGWVITSLKVLFASIRRFIADDCLTRASSISYTAIMSLIPTLTVVLTVYSIFSGVEGKKEELFGAISFFMKDHGINITIDPIFVALSGLIDNAGKIGGISAVVMVFTATALLRSLERSLNTIWSVKKNRPIFLRVIYYWAILTLGPVTLIGGTAVTTQLSDFFSAPNYHSIAFTGSGERWIVGGKGGIYRMGKSMELIPLAENRIDFDNQKSYLFNEASGMFEEKDHRIDQVQFEKSEFNKILFRGDAGWIVGNRGILLKTDDGGMSWALSRLDSFNLRDLWMLNRDHGFIVGDRGVLLQTDDGGLSWSFVRLPGVTRDLNSINFADTRGLVTGDSGMLVHTYDGGTTWIVEKLKSAELSGRHVNLFSSCIVNDYTCYLGGSEGIVLRSTNGGITWASKKFRAYSYRAIHFFNSREGIAAGDRGSLAITKNGGDSWTRTRLPTYQINALTVQGTAIWAVGDTGLVMSSADRGRHWEGVEGRSIIAFLINFLAPFVFIWLLFLVAYIALPNTRVPFKVAAIGASFTSAVWAVFILLFIYYTKTFARGTLAIYGALAAIPLFLLIVYSSSVIILLGAELSYVLMHPESYSTLDLRRGTRTGRMSAYHALAILHRIYGRFEQGKGPTGFRDLLPVAGDGAETVDFFTALFGERELINRLPDGRWTPSRPSQSVIIAEVMEYLDETAYTVPSPRGTGRFRHDIHRLFRRIIASRRETLKGITLADLLGKDAGHST
ncbi:MAG: YihY family inner membrane protein [Spirochaetes bacterium]|nr:YihY family inner membrane protein [Spirochaetota bacterium]